MFLIADLYIINRLFLVYQYEKFILKEKCFLNSMINES